ncbi:YIP1 family protein [Streptomyces sp. H10-C2]|uniref:YIP1 family protein n=1 Tax=unclassified Streptomyces TaxID=2593676 RepID=UPI0024B98096|nr:MULTISPECIES: YIP1 family protein [unclassified Streptomyces]MDJ0340369.1 YIP1 family protein [Streptomyces sp. PH10-H1]MDJ0368183.1 YIP1 family protein [Streptomyces sp. H10-C2]
MSQVGRKAPRTTGLQAQRPAGTGTFDDVAGFRNRRGRDHSGQPPEYGQQAPQEGGQQQYGRPGPSGGQPEYGRPGYGQPQGRPQGYGGAPSGEPEYFGEPAPAPAPAYDDNPGHTRAFTLGGAADQFAPYSGPDQDGPGNDNIATYRAGQATAPPSGPRLHWKQLIRGIVLRPGHTFWQMRDYPVWGPALIVTFLYGLLAVFGFDAARKDILNATVATSVPWVISTGVAVTLSGLMLGAVTHALARQLGGDGSWAPTIGLAMLVTSLTDAPRLLFALFLGSANGLVQILGWVTWLACAALLTSMVSKSHDLPWPKALGAASIQLIALLVLFKLPLI